jgi:hypothetical protein
MTISLDELAIGFSLGLPRLSVVSVVAAIAVQAFVAVQLGLLLGARPDTPRWIIRTQNRSGQAPQCDHVSHSGLRWAHSCHLGLRPEDCHVAARR